MGICIGRLALAALLSCIVPGVCTATTVTGRVATDSVIWVSDGSVPEPAQKEMRNVDKTFVPELVAVPIGGTVRFPNDAPFFHSIYSATAPNAFDLGYYLTGPGKDVVFSHPGVLDVRCHIHVKMHANIVVVDGPYAQGDAAFTIANVRPGEHQLHVWDLANGMRTSTIRVPADGTLALPGTLR